MCPKCKHPLSWRDNIPLLSFVLLSGRCRFCRKPISWQYPVVELATVVVTVIVGFGWLGSLGWLGVLGVLVIAWAFIVIFFADFLYGLIPDEMEVVIVGAALALKISQIGQIGLIGQIWSDGVAGLVSGLAFLAIVVATRFRGMGLGDVKLAFVMGFLLGFPKVLVAFWFAFILGGVYALFLLGLRRKKIHDTIALGPFLVIGVAIAAGWSGQLLQLIGL